MELKFKSIDDIKQVGFTGFRKMGDLFDDSSMIPDIKGVYFVLYTANKPSEFLVKGTGGFFKGKDPNVLISELKQNWVDDAIIVYIGQAGGGKSQATLKSRLKQYFYFGQGKNIGHRGGRYIWQLKNSTELVVCWKPFPKEDPRAIEKDLISQFHLIYGKRPFANLKN